ncbi:MAG: type II toxin-antitoxin system VapC family toxin [Symploca sp. SIO2E6]|nr:type II toxin-antitoxin system VapC family toxin [Symploca sp. SIO2E6]
MKILIDTHVLIWWSGEPSRLSPWVYNFLSDPKNEPILSLVSIWEMQIKMSLGKLSIKTALPELVNDEIRRNRIILLPIQLSHIYALKDLPPHHRDPFDRLLIAQSMQERLDIISIDDKLDAYGIRRLW